MLLGKPSRIANAYIAVAAAAVAVAVDRPTPQGRGARRVPSSEKRGLFCIIMIIFFFLLFIHILSSSRRSSIGEKEEETLKINFRREVYILINYTPARVYKGVSVILLLERKIAYKTAREFMCVKNTYYYTLYITLAGSRVYVSFSSRLPIPHLSLSLPFCRFSFRLKKLENPILARPYY